MIKNYHKFGTILSATILLLAGSEAYLYSLVIPTNKITIQQQDVYVEQIISLKKCVVLIFVPGNGYKSGTGVAINESSRTVIVTNQHIVGNSSVCLIGIGGDEEDKVEFVWGNVVATSTTLDLAAITMNSVYKELKSELEKINYFLKSQPDSSSPDLRELFDKYKVDELIYSSTNRTRKTDALLNVGINFNLTDINIGDASMTKVGKQTTFLGFPLRIGQWQRDPVARSGIVARELASGDFFIDAMVSHGNSGSPVFVFGAAKEDNTIAPYLVGIAKAFRSDYVGEFSTGPYHNAGLGYVIGIKNIMDFIFQNRNKILGN
ncbi:MAG: hypothetical protein HY606_02075 [Planctomycetes bacterium]|nr:hypothetical protein [Planctomycetota bacterium]